MKKLLEKRRLSRELREAGESLDAIYKKLGVSKTTVYGWIKDMPVPVIDGISIRDRAINPKYWSNETIKKRSDSIKKVWRKKREDQYKKGYAETASLMKDKFFRDFICLYLAEGFRKTRHAVSVVNTDPAIIVLCNGMIKKFSNKQVGYRVFGEDSEKEKLTDFWGKILNIEKTKIKFQIKKKIHGRRAEFGLIEVRVNDTYFRSKLQAWMDVLQDEWKREFGGVAQSEEYLSVEQDVAGS